MLVSLIVFIANHGPKVLLTQWISEQSQYPACGTYIWTGSPARSMYRCFAATTIVSMLDQPQFVIDAALSSNTASTTSSGTSTTSSDGSTSTSNSGGGGSSSSNTGAIVGGVVGGVAGIALIVGAIVFFIMRKNKKNREKQAYNAVPVNEHNAPGHPGSGQPAMSYAGGAGPTTYPPQEPFYPAMAGQHDPRQSYVQSHDPRQSYVQSPDPNAQHHQYDPSKQGHYAATDVHPGAPGSPGYAGYQYPQTTNSIVAGAPHQGVVASELDGNVPAGHESNPVEMASSPQGH
jgi:hypothetical protein